jgi:hypothetical protein
VRNPLSLLKFAFRVSKLAWPSLCMTLSFVCAGNLKFAVDSGDKGGSVSGDDDDSSDSGDSVIGDDGG